MFKTPLILAAAELALAACGSMQQEGSTTQGVLPLPDVGKGRDVQPFDLDPGFSVAVFPPPPRCEVRVYVSPTDEIRVDPEVIPIGTCGNPAKVVWKITSGSSPDFRFDANYGVVFDKPPLPSPLPSCVMALTGKAVLCRFTPQPGKIFPYSVTVLKNGVALPKLDPWVFNN